MTRGAEPMSATNDVFERSASLSPSKLDRLRRFDATTWNEMTVTFAPLVLRWVARAGLQAEDASDVVQEVFRGVAKTIGDFRRDRPGDTFRGWLFAITKHKLAEFQRRRRKTPMAIGGSDALGRLHQLAVDHDADALDPEDGFTDLVQRVFAMIRCEFNDQDVEAFQRIVIDGESPADVARQLGCSTNSVYLAKSRILRRLRQGLFEDLD
jgi:RNA polymerase sigma-70 factor (ECF subfamily)